MAELHLVYQHWFITLILLWLGGGAMFNGIALVVRAWRRLPEPPSTGTPGTGSGT